VSVCGSSIPNATINCASIVFVGRCDDAGVRNSTNESEAAQIDGRHETVSFVYDTIEWSWLPGRITAEDAWAVEQ
jgi:type VI protein secretion system component Hcp